jgi:hypothetical protein
MKKLLALLLSLAFALIPSGAYAVEQTRYPSQFTYACYDESMPTTTLDGQYAFLYNQTVNGDCRAHLNMWVDFEGRTAFNFCIYSLVVNGPKDGGLQFVGPNGFSAWLGYTGGNFGTRCTGATYVGYGNGYTGWLSVYSYGDPSRKDKIRWVSITPIRL